MTTKKKKLKKKLKQESLANLQDAVFAAGHDPHLYDIVNNDAMYTGDPAAAPVTVVTTSGAPTSSYYMNTPAENANNPVPEPTIPIHMDTLQGLIVFYCNISEVPQFSLSQHMDELLKNNDHLADMFGKIGFESIWFAHRGKRASHVELWPLDTSKERRVRFLIQKPPQRSDSYHRLEGAYYRSSPFIGGGESTSRSSRTADERSDHERQALALIEQQFTEKYPTIISGLQKQHFTIEWHATSYPTRVVVH